MKKDKYIDDLFKQNEEGFNKPPSADAWNKLEAQLQSSHSTSKRKSYRWLYMTAASVLFAVSFLFINNQFSKKMTSNHFVHNVNLDTSKTQTSEIQTSTAIEMESTNVTNDDDNNHIENQSLKVPSQSQETKSLTNKTSAKNKNSVIADIAKDNASKRNDSTTIDNYKPALFYYGENADAFPMKTIVYPEEADVSRDEEVIKQQINDELMESQLADRSFSYNQKDGARGNAQGKHATTQTNTVKSISNDTKVEFDSDLNTNIEDLNGQWLLKDMEENAVIQVESKSRKKSSKEANMPSQTNVWNITIENNFAFIDFDSDHSFGTNQIELALNRNGENNYYGECVTDKKTLHFTFHLTSENNLHIFVKQNNKEYNVFYFERTAQ